MTENRPLRIVIARRRQPLPTVEEVRAVVPDAEIEIVPEDDLEGAVADADIVATVLFPPEALARAKRLKWVHTWAAGPDKILHDAMRAHPVVLTSCVGNGAVPLAEHGIMLMLMLDRDARTFMARQAESKWGRIVHGELNGRTCGIIGAGHSGLDLALKAKAFHMNVLGYRRQDRPAANFDEMFTGDGLHEFLARSDFVVVTAALTEDTRGLLGEAEFRAMKPTAHYICYSRGAIAETDALVRALREGWIAGAGLDAHAVEPLPADSPFWTMPNVIVTPHMGATSTDTPRRGHEMFLENLRRFVAGEPLMNLVDKRSGY